MSVRVEVVDAQKVLQVPDSLCTHAMAYKMDLPLTVPTSWNSVWESKDIILSDLPKESWFIIELLHVFFAEVLMAINGSD